MPEQTDADGSTDLPTDGCSSPIGGGEAVTDGGKSVTSDEQTAISATVPVDTVLFALTMNATNGADDRVIAVPQRDGARAKIRYSFSGSERYENPESAPVHIRPESLVEDSWTRPPRRGQIDCAAIDVPELPEDRDDEDEQRIDETHDVLMDDWRATVRGMIQDEHECEFKGCQITLVGVEGEQ